MHRQSSEEGAMATCVLAPVSGVSNTASSPALTSFPNPVGGGAVSDIRVSSAPTCHRPTCCCQRIHACTCSCVALSGRRQAAHASSGARACACACR